MTKKSVRQHVDEGRFVEAEQYALAMLAFVLSDALVSSGLTQRQLAQRLGVSEARISQVLNADGNLTVKTLARIADALNSKLSIRFAELDATVRRPDLTKREPTRAANDGPAAIDDVPPDHDTPNNVIVYTCNEKARQAWSHSVPETASPEPEFRDEGNRHAVFG